MTPKKIKTGFLLFIGVISLALGFVGIFIPLLPTTPFLLLAAWCFMKSSPRLNQWLLEHPTFGPVIYSWRERKAIPIQAKIIAAIMILASLASVWIFAANIYLKLTLSSMLLGATLFIWTRPTS